MNFIKYEGFTFFLQKMHIKFFSDDVNAAHLNNNNFYIKRNDIDKDFLFLVDCLMIFLNRLLRLIKKNKKRNEVENSKVKYTKSFKTFLSHNNNQLIKYQNHFLNHMHTVGEKYKFIFYIYSIKNNEDFFRTIDSVNNQVYKNFEVYIPQFHKKNISVNYIKKLSSDYDFVIPVRSGDILDQLFLYECFSLIYERDDKLDLIYFNNVFYDTNYNLIPFIKPNFSPDYLESLNYFGSTVCLRKKIFQNEVLFFKRTENIYDLLLRVTEKTTNIGHIDSFLFFSKILSVKEWNKLSIIEKRALGHRLRRTSRVGKVILAASFPNVYNMKILDKKRPLVSIVIPTAGKIATISKRKIDLLINLLNQINKKSTYKNLEIIVVDGGELSPAQIEALIKFNCKRVIHKNSVFNFSNSCNIGASQTTGEYIIFLNDDIEIISPDWVERMLSHFQKKHVGVVGAMLLYPNGKLQHAGVVMNNGCPDHVSDGLSDSKGYFFSAYAPRNFSAVTGACLMIRKSIFNKVKGFRESLRSNFNDTDLCFKVRSKGFFVVLEPTSKLTHMTSMSRIDFNASSRRLQSELEIFQDIWSSEPIIDPYYNQKYLNTGRPSFTPRFFI
ncbi:glycosyltransferase family 2 protein [Candidatus Methylopumilus universalis]|uniref:glycosyltransferase family 2 protein n=1 Tax=Candidatus Methylopumilus universalis TaxID=2588536 RepID=UPI0016780CA5|nr:glycosyltransferase [Candidatus Methylopumilus universalis]